MLKRLLPILCLLTISAASIPAHAWGCEGHQIVALIALKHLQPQVAAQVNAILAAGPVASDLRRYCRNAGLPPAADAATWADDYRSTQPETGPYHFIDIPLTVTREKYDISPLCQQGCVVEALNKYAQTLKRSTDPKARADALRFIIHFVGDVHQPLHDSTNGDRGGNCVPVSYEDEIAHPTNPQHGDYFPNLHSVWDTEIIQGLLGDHDMTVEQFAEYLDERYQPRLRTWNSGQPLDWAWEGHDLAVHAYRSLPVNVPHDNTVQVASCAENNNVGTRMAALHIDLGERYENANRPIVEEQLTKAGVRLAGLLNTALAR
jgi:hypothetical protein